MNDTTTGLIAALLAYGIGSLPFGFWVAKLVSGRDIREQGSGNIGATNVARVLGAKWGATVLFLDCLKGLLPVLLLPPLFLASESSAFVHVKVACGVAAIIGHMFPLWLRFRGGKGMATALGVVLVLGWQATLAAMVVFATVVLATRIVSLASMLAAVAFAAVQMWQLTPDPFSPEHRSLAVFSLVVPLLIIYRHRANIVRLAKGEEPRFRFGSSGPSNGDSAGCPHAER